MSGTGGSQSATHIPVLAERIVELLAPSLDRPEAVYVDCTLGLGGHANLILQTCGSASLIGIDRDPQALAEAGRRLSGFGERVALFHAVYDELGDVLAEAGVRGVQAICLDLGLSSLQIDQTERGFAYATNAPLDMRMNPDQELTAATIVNTWDAAELTRILRVFGDERNAPRIVRGILAARQAELFQDSGRLVKVIADSLPFAVRNSGGHPAKRTFQALRIAVNDELSALSAVLPVALSALAPGGRLAVLAYHSGEDRLVKQALAAAASDRVPPGVPMVPAGYAADFRLLTRGAERPTTEEVARNPRAASARLRAIARNEEAAA